MRKCHYIYDKEAGKVLIPGCWGSAVYGPHACNCYPVKVPTEKQLYKKYIRELEKENARLWRIIKRII